jgi:hypothetical protein
VSTEVREVSEEEQAARAREFAASDPGSA